jgi:predicted phosphodiesterase
MRLAIIADIHGNVLALEAVIADLVEAAPDLVVNLGDCVSGPLWPRETLDILMAKDWPTVRGNHDRWVAKTPRVEQMGSDAHAYDALDARGRDWLGALPGVLRRDDILMFHARPDDDNAYLLDTTADGVMISASKEEIAARLGAERAPLMLCGHSHLPRVVTLDESLIVNPGSVGCPGYEDPTPPSPHVMEVGSPHARYALATLRNGVWRIDQRAVAYDWNRAAQQAERLGRAAWARALATGFVR